MQPIVEVTDTPLPADLRPVSEGLDRFNAEVTGIDDRTPLAVLVRDPRTGEVVGGLTGRTSLGLLFVDLLYLPPALRGTGLGTELLRRAEHEARTRGCRAAVLYTISFQAPGFYRKLGWQPMGEVPCDPPGASRVFLTKDLTGAERSEHAERPVVGRGQAADEVGEADGAQGREAAQRRAGGVGGGGPEGGDSLGGGRLHGPSVGGSAGRRADRG